ncbi:hypothetical protein PC116_g16641 [Phytophthora cactorum]|uniref:Uncharacterized protein n=1 Tax=Phytophthora cactorum TaxID=29920 RepID=A0A8T1KJ90_9STRA|nr:hypothetical protein Pcac1_g18288 [Phytophthora cactorum]KAG2986469.1 hypothetical protein PC118_g7792 [Phytophthora cactorum]KAG3159245.1 hypothetical protein C6341_g14139 [Phytophthora cactorum]KAG4235215.1 hypothetical protein PC116_g16641 [Phytophthora cactorum]
MQESVTVLVDAVKALQLSTTFTIDDITFKLPGENEVHLPCNLFRRRSRGPSSATEEHQDEDEGETTPLEDFPSGGEFTVAANVVSRKSMAKWDDSSA